MEFDASAFCSFRVLAKTVLARLSIIAHSFVYKTFVLGVVLYSCCWCILCTMINLFRLLYRANEHATVLWEYSSFCDNMYKCSPFGRSFVLSCRMTSVRNATRGLFSETGKWPEKLNTHIRLNIEKYWKDKLHHLDCSVNSQASICGFRVAAV